MAQINGTDGPDQLNGEVGDDEIRGFRGSDTITASDGNDILYGGRGRDLLNLLGAGDDQFAFGGIGDDFILFGVGADQVFGGTLNDTFQWTSGFGVSTIDTTKDFVFGGADTDTLIADFSFSASINNITLSGDANGTRTFLADGVEIMDLTSIEQIDFEVPLGTNLAGYVGSTGSDSLQLFAGTHTVDTGTGADAVGILLDGNLDTIDMSNGTDRLFITYDDSLTNLVFDLKSGAITADGSNVLEYSSVELFSVISSGSTDDLIVATAGADFINGGLGSDTIRTGGSDDTITVDTRGGDLTTVVGGAGTDTLIINGADQITAGTRINMDGTIGDTVAIRTSGSATVSATQVEQISVVGSDGGDNLFGLLGNDTIEGGAGNDVMIGRGGDDTIITNGGLDTATGGGGSDTFVFGEDAFGPVKSLTVTDFTSEDQVALDLSAFDGVDFTVGETPDFISGAGLDQATGSGSQFIYDTDTGRLFLDVDGAGGEARDLLGRLFLNNDVASLTADQIDII